MARNNPYIQKMSDWQNRLTNFGLNLPEKQQISWVSDCCSERDIICEIGSGSGSHLIELARRHPTYACFGFELRYKRAIRTLEKCQKEGIENVYLLRGNAKFIAEVFSGKRLKRVYVNFPDPWDKKSWNKNRIIQPSFLEALCELLTADGFLSYKTDHEGYFNETLKLINNFSGFQISEISRDLYQSAYIAQNIPTEFENLFTSKSQAIFYLKANKKNCID